MYVHLYVYTSTCIAIVEWQQKTNEIAGSILNIQFFTAANHDFISAEAIYSDKLSFKIYHYHGRNTEFLYPSATCCNEGIELRLPVCIRILKYSLQSDLNTYWPGNVHKKNKRNRFRRRVFGGLDGQIMSEKRMQPKICKTLLLWLSRKNLL